MISVIIPTYKGNDSLKIALNSLVNQTSKDFEVIVSDDNEIGSKDQIDTKKIVLLYEDRLRITYIGNGHHNGSYARNRGLEVSKGDIIAFLDDDDYFMPRYIEKSVDAFNRYNVDFVFFDVAIVTREGVCRLVSNHEIDYLSILFGQKEIGTGSNLCFRRRVYDESAGFDERYLRQQDIEFVVKKLHKYKSVWINELLIVKYFNKTDNYLNYQKSIDMQKLFRDDLKANRIISQEESDKLRNYQLHSLYNDMLVKNVDKRSVKEVYLLLKNSGNLTLFDRLMYIFYINFPKTFNSILNIYLNRKKNDIDVKFLLDYRDLLEKM